MPLWLLLRNAGPRPHTLAATGALAAVLPVAAALGWVAAHQAPSPYVVIYNLLLFTLGGAVAGWTFWRVQRRRPVPRQ